jgi:perosamine synthetase
MDAINDIAKTHKLFVVEDNAECFLGRYKGRLVGTLGDCASFSFQSSKHVTSGEGGVLITQDLQLAENVRRVQSLGYAGVGAKKGKITKKDIQDPNYSRHVVMGWNYRMAELCAAVALAQVENLDALVACRVDASRLFTEVAREVDWLVPQHVGADYEHSYWTWVALLKRPDISWHAFRDRFTEFGGDGIYAAWKLTYLEPMFERMQLLGREKFISAGNRAAYVPGLCPIAERIQPRLLQFKTNYWNFDEAARQAEILRRTIRSF